MQTSSPSFAVFGISFQESLVSLILRDNQFSNQIKEVLEPGFFELKSLQILVKKIYEFKEKYQSHPSVSSLSSVLNTDLIHESNQVEKQVKDLFHKITNIKQVENEEYIRDKSIDFCKKHVLKNAMIKSIDLLEKSSFNELATVINDALKLGLNNDLGHEYIKDFEDRFNIKQRIPITSGWEEIDKITSGGFGKGELGIIIAPSSGGKSMCLVHFGCQVLKVGKTVVYYTFELQDRYVGRRFDACLTGIPIDDLQKNKDKIKNVIDRISGNLIIKEYPCKSVSVMGIRNHLEKLKQKNIKPDLILVDYLDLLKPTLSGEKEKRFVLESISEELRALAQFSDCAVLTATQGNRASSNAALVTMAEISESFAKVFIADFVMTLSRTKEDKLANTGRFHVVKNRLGIDGIVLPIFFDPSIVSIKILEKELNPFEKSKQSKQLLQEQYKKYVIDNNKRTKFGQEN